MQAIKAALDLKLFTKLKGKKLDCKTLSELFDITFRKPEEFFDVLVSLNVLERSFYNIYFNS
jgi:hypothetical protein